MPVIDNMMLAAPDQPGETPPERGLPPSAPGGSAKNEVREQAMELLEVFNLTEARGCATPARSPAASASCSSSPGR